MNEENKEDKTESLKKLIKLRNTKKIIFKGIYTKYDRKIVN